MTKKTIYPRYFQGSENPTDIVVFPAEGSKGTTYYTDLKRWSLCSFWSLSDMATSPEDNEILRWQAIVYGVPSELPPFRAEPVKES